MRAPLRDHSLKDGFAEGCTGSASPGGARDSLPNHSFQTDVRRLSGAHAARIIDAPHNRVRAHAHDWAVLSLYVAGGVRNETEEGGRDISAPCVVLYGRGAAHANAVGAVGFEQVQIEFDPDWLKLEPVREQFRPHCWTGGSLAPAARELARLWCTPEVSEEQLARQTRDFLRDALRTEPPPRPRWLGFVQRRLRGGDPPSAASLAAELRVSAHWLRQAYRAATGEGLRETLRRHRVEAAASLLRHSSLGAAEIACRSGFCDQSHMVRCFAAVLGRTPLKVRTEWQSAR